MKIITFFDVSENWQFGFQDAATPVMEGIINFHHDLMFFLIIITVFISWLLFRIIISFNEDTHAKPSTFVHHSLIEVIWTIIPAAVLLAISVPSFALLYSMDEVVNPTITLKITGSQWYWTYELVDTDGECYKVVHNSYMTPSEDLDIGQFRLLEVNKRILLPTNTHIRIVITSSDVLHSWAVPSLGIKLDACPGRLNQTSVFLKREGIFMGQCSEICGVNHAFMPVVIQAVNWDQYIAWYYEL